MYINVISAYRDIVTLADEDLIGKVFYEGKKQLDVKESFYKGKIKKREEICELLGFYRKEDAIFNIVGEKSVSLAIEEGLISADSVLSIDGVPYSMVLL